MAHERAAERADHAERLAGDVSHRLSLVRAAERDDSERGRGDEHNGEETSEQQPLGGTLFRGEVRHGRSFSRRERNWQVTPGFMSYGPSQARTSPVATPSGGGPRMGGARRRAAGPRRE